MYLLSFRRKNDIFTSERDLTVNVFHILCGVQWFVTYDSINREPIPAYFHNRSTKWNMLFEWNISKFKAEKIIEVYKA